MNDYRTEMFQKLVAQVVEWDPADHHGRRESWESMEATMNDVWATYLAEHGAQETHTGHETRRDTDLRTDRRRVVRIAWTLPVDVPADLAARCNVETLHGYLTWDPTSHSETP